MRTDVTMPGLLLVAALGAVLGGYDLRPAAPSDRGVLRETTAMRVNRAAHTATPLPDGRVLVVGGFIEKGSASGAEILRSVGRRVHCLFLP